MKIAPFIKAINRHNTEHAGNEIDHILVHTGQHYDYNMSGAFFNDLGIPEPDINLGVGSGSHAEQVGRTMIEFEKILRIEKPDWVVVVGDVNATLACSVTAKKENIKCCHIEAGLRSGDMTMPEEINRLVTDRISDLLLAQDNISMNNLLREGIPENRLKLVGNIMIDTLDSNIDLASVLDINSIINNNYLSEADSEGQRYLINKEEPFAVITLHRPSNVDSEEVLKNLSSFFSENLTSKMIILWPVHPRTEHNLKKSGIWQELEKNRNIYLLKPLTYLEMLKLNLEASILLTDSGGLQEECTVTGTPCITLRNNTERPATLRENGGVSILVGNNVKKIEDAIRSFENYKKEPKRPYLWDGKTAVRCLQAIIGFQDV